MNITASPTLATQSLAGIVDPSKPKQVAFSPLGIANFAITMKRYQKNIDHNSERRVAHDYVILTGEIYIPLSSVGRK